MTAPLTYAELFAGAGGLSLGLEMAGWEPVAHAEIEPHARAVLRHHWPTTRLDGDVTALDGRDYRGVTLLSGGSPCQDLSIAGKRAGMTEGSGTRSALYFEQVRIWQESEAPYFLWENVLGALSSNAGRDFAAVLSAVVGAPLAVPDDGWRGAGVASGPAGVAAWRVLDAQFLGVPQRRRRVFVLGARAGGVDPAEVLLEELVPVDDPRRPAWMDDLRDGLGSGWDTKRERGDESTVQLAGDERYLTPTETERLMGWPDGHTAHGRYEDGADSALADITRYRLTGNGVASPVAAWIGWRLRDAIREHGPLTRQR